jgi:hypothetical protein
MVPKASSKAPLTGLSNPDGLLDGNFNVGPVRPRSSPCESDKWANLGPRARFAYDVGGKGKTAVRGGFGELLSGLIPGSPWAHVQPTPSAPFRFSFTRADATRLGIRWPTYNDDLIKIIESETAARGWINTSAVINPRIQNPCAMHFSLGIQREIRSNLASGESDDKPAGPRGSPGPAGLARGRRHSVG